MVTAWTPQPYFKLLAIYSTLAHSLSKQVRVGPFVLRAYNLHCCTAQGMAPNAMEIEHEVAAWRCFITRACFSSLGVTLVSVPDNPSFECEFYLHPSSLFVVVWSTFHLAIFCLQDSTMAPNASQVPRCALKRAFLSGNRGVGHWLAQLCLVWLVGCWLDWLLAWLCWFGWLAQPANAWSQAQGPPWREVGGSLTLVLYIPNVLGDFAAITKT